LKTYEFQLKNQHPAVRAAHYTQRFAVLQIDFIALNRTPLGKAGGSLIEKPRVDGET
jgi:hypothetical protein